MAQLLYWIVLVCTGVSNVVVDENVYILYMNMSK